VVWTLLLEWLGAEVIRLLGEGSPPTSEHDVLVCEPVALSRPWLRALAQRLPTIVTGEQCELPDASVLEKPIYPSVLSRTILELASAYGPRSTNHQ
jgi:hypothetical protein